MRYSGSDQQKALWDNFRNGCNLQDEWIKRWESDIHRTEIVIAIKVWYDKEVQVGSKWNVE